MWIFAKVGFVSIVKHRELKGLIVRARFKEDADAFHAACMEASENFKDEFEPSPIISSPDRDYAFRFYCDPKVISFVIMEMVEAIDYTNFKSAVHGDPIRDQAYMQCWAAMESAQHKKGDRSGKRSTKKGK